MASRLLALFCLLLSSLFAGWNEDFYEQTMQLCETIDVFGQESYIDSLDRFLIYRKMIEQKTGVLRSMCCTRPHFGEGYVLKLRPVSGLNEVLFGELAYLLELGDYGVCAYPVNILNRSFIIQEFEEGYIGDSHVLPPPPILETVLLEDYILAHLTAYVLGLGDISTLNFAISLEGKIRFFDNEYCLVERGPPRRQKRSFFLDFCSIAFDWPHYRQRIDRQTAKSIREVLTLLETKRAEIVTYGAIRGLLPSQIESILERITLLQTYDFAEGTAFEEFFAHLYPRVFEGMEELCQIIGRMIERECDHGTALFYAVNVIPHYKFAKKGLAELAAWCRRYID